MRRRWFLARTNTGAGPVCRAGWLPICQYRGGPPELLQGKPVRRAEIEPVQLRAQSAIGLPITAAATMARAFLTSGERTLGADEPERRGAREPGKPGRGVDHDAGRAVPAF